jgi:hypothetical protein
MERTEFFRRQAEQFSALAVLAGAALNFRRYAGPCGLLHHSQQRLT